MLLYQQSATYTLTFRLTTHSHMVNWKEHCETERWAGNCLTFYDGSLAEAVDKDKLIVTGKKKKKRSEACCYVQV